MPQKRYCGLFSWPHCTHRIVMAIGITILIQMPIGHDPLVRRPFDRECVVRTGRFSLRPLRPFLAFFAVIDLTLHLSSKNRKPHEGGQEIAGRTQRPLLYTSVDSVLP